MVEMIPSVQERKKNVHHFMNSYPYLCRLQNSVPNPCIKIDSSNNILDFIGDRLKLDEWKPLLEAISNDRSLHFINIRSRHSKAKVLQETNTEDQVRHINTPKSSPLFTSFVLIKITEALSKCLASSLALSGLLLEKIPLNSESLNLLTQGLEGSHNLQQLSLPYAQIGDDGCASLCHVLRRRLNLVWLNLSGCGLTDKGVGTLCNLLKFQKLNRYGESWKQSLRCRPVNPNLMPGLRRLTLNHNPIGDAGVQIFVDTLVDDLWLKALDLQYCSVSLVGAEALLNLVKENQFLSVVDVRGNLQVPKSLVAAIVQQLAENNGDTTPEWLKEDSQKSVGRSSSGTCVSRNSQRLLSNTTLASKGLSVLPNKPRPQSISLPLHTRSSSAKRVHSTNNTPRPPWNWSNPSLKRGNSDQIIATTRKPSHDVLTELQAVKQQLQNVSQRLEEETRRRVKIEEELEKYKHMLELPDSSMSVDKDTLQTIFQQFYNAYLTKDTPSTPKCGEDMTNDDPTGMQKHDSLESVIRTINGENPLGLNLNLTDSHALTDQCNAQNAPSQAQLLFETLISS